MAEGRPLGVAEEGLPLGARLAVRRGEEWREARVTMHSRELVARAAVLLKHRLEFDDGHVGWYDLSELEFTYATLTKEGMDERMEAAWRAGAQAEAEARGLPGGELLGSQLFVFANGEWQAAVVLAFKEESGKHQLKFAGTGSVTWLSLRNERWLHASLISAANPVSASGEVNGDEGDVAGNVRQRRQRPRRAASIATERIDQDDASAADPGEEAEVSSDDNMLDIIGLAKHGHSRSRTRKRSARSGRSTNRTPVVRGNDGADEGETELEGLPGWAVERVPMANGRLRRVLVGPGGVRAISRAHALRGGSKPREAVVKKAVQQMSIVELISNRTHGVPMKAPSTAGKRRRSGLPQSAEEAMETEDAEVVAFGPQLSGDVVEQHDNGSLNVVRLEIEHGGDDDDGRQGWYEHDQLEADNDGEEGAEVDAPREDDATVGFVPQLRIVNGQIVLDEDSMQVTATRTQADLSRMDAPVEEMTASSVTSASYLKRASAIPWTAEETEKFYDSLRKYGTDFTLIAALFPNRNRTHIKKKFKKEEKENPRRIDRVLQPGSYPEVDGARRQSPNESSTAMAPLAHAASSTNRPASVNRRPASGAMAVVGSGAPLSTGANTPIVPDSIPTAAPRATLSTDGGEMASEAISMAPPARSRPVASGILRVPPSTPHSTAMPPSSATLLAASQPAAPRSAAPPSAAQAPATPLPALRRNPPTSGPRPTAHQPAIPRPTSSLPAPHTDHPLHPPRDVTRSTPRPTLPTATATSRRPTSENSIPLPKETRAPVPKPVQAAPQPAATALLSASLMNFGRRNLQDEDTAGQAEHDGWDYEGQNDFGGDEQFAEDYGAYEDDGLGDEQDY